MMPKFIYFWLVIFITFTLTSCMVGPNFHSPRGPHPHRFTRDPLPRHTVSTPSLKNAGKSQHFVYGKNISAQWWRIFHSPELNSLINTGIANNQNLAAAYAALRQAQELLNVQIGNSLFPAIGAVANTQRSRSTGAFLGDVFRGTIFNVVNANVNVSYTLDIFGGARRQIEALMAQVDYQQFQLIATYNTLTTNIVTTAVTAASLEAQIAATNELLKNQTTQLKILEKQMQLGGESRIVVLAQETVVEQTRATLPPLERSLAQNLHALSVLVGKLPSVPVPWPVLEKINLPADLPLSVPSNLVRQRPDVRAAEALLHAATAQIGVATAALFPQLTLTGSYGWQSPRGSNLFSPINLVWNMMSQVTQPIFQGGALFAQRRASIAAFDESYAQYKQTVLTAFQNVADTLKALEKDAETLQALRAAEEAARLYLELTQDQFKLGGISYLSLVIAQQQYQRSKIARIRAQADRYVDTATLFQALGGGWWNTNWCIKVALGYC